LLRERLGLGTGLARHEFEESTTLFDGVDGDRDMVDHTSHRRMLHSTYNGDKEKRNANE
jgi:hypothetical protein